MRNFIYLLLLGVILVTIAIGVRSGIFARKDPGTPINSAMREALAKTHDYTAEEQALIEKTYGGAEKLPSGLRILARNQGTGLETPKSGQQIICNYSGRLLDGSEFDSSYRRGAPITFRLGTGQVIKGWEEAFTHLHKGQRATLIIPHWLGYGEKGSPPNIPPKATLVFEVELIDWR